MNVLVYSGPEVLQTSLSHCFNTLRPLLVPNYAVQTISRQSLISHPWTANCALLVIPPCKTSLNTTSISASIRSYVEQGGSLLAFGAGVHIPPAASRAESLKVLQERLDRIRISDNKKLSFVESTTGREIHVEFAIHADVFLTLTTIKWRDSEPLTCVRSNVEAGHVHNPTPLVAARYASEDYPSGVAAVHFADGKGQVVVWEARIDQPLTEEPASTILKEGDNSLSQEQLISEENKRLDIIRSTLRALNLVLPEQSSASLSPLPQFLTSTPSKPWIISRVMQALSIGSLQSSPFTFQDSNDTFIFHSTSRGWAPLDDARSSSKQSPTASLSQPKTIIVCTNELLPTIEQTPLFNILQFYKDLSSARVKAGFIDTPDGWGIGEAFLYAEVVTSTQTMLDGNPRLLSSTPSPLVSLASHQLAGRGRGTNVWLSPSGCLQFSLLLRVSLSELPASRLVFVQYLFALAVVEACRDEAVIGAEGKRVRLKWPNDIYAIREDGQRKKIGGILVNTSFSGGKVEIVIGSGLNVWNPPPIQSLLQLLPPDSNAQLSMERTAAAILVKFENMWTTFLSERGSFKSFEDLYYDRWLHSDQLVELTTITPSQKVRIVGITSDHGLLRTMPERDGWSNSGSSFIDLQPDGNSFDMLAGLITAKT